MGNVTDLATTPLVRIEDVLVKIECVHPCGSVKDRIAVYILRESERRGLLRPGMRVVEATSGNTGIAFAHYAREMGYPVTIVMPEHMTEERKDLIRALGAELILCSADGSFAEAARIRDEMAAADPNVFNPDQFGNPLNVECHRETTGRELIEQSGVRIDAFVAGVGTGGTLIGIGEALRAKWPDVHLAAVEPAEAAVMSGGGNHPHKIFGIGDGFIPAIAGDGNGGLNAMIDEVVVISSDDAIETAQRLNEEHHFCVGISSGANFLAAKKLQERYEIVATVFSDGYSKYQSHGLHSTKDDGCPFGEMCRESVISRLNVLGK